MDLHLTVTGPVASAIVSLLIIWLRYRSKN